MAKRDRRSNRANLQNLCTRCAGASPAGLPQLPEWLSNPDSAQLAIAEVRDVRVFRRGGTYALWYNLGSGFGHVGLGRLTYQENRVPDELYVVFVSLALIVGSAFPYFVWQLLRKDAPKCLNALLTLGLALAGFLATVPFGATRGWWLTVVAGGYYVLVLLVAILYVQVRDEA